MQRQALGGLEAKQGSTVSRLPWVAVATSSLPWPSKSTPRGDGIAMAPTTFVLPSGSTTSTTSSCDTLMATIPFHTANESPVRPPFHTEGFFACCLNGRRALPEREKTSRLTSWPPYIRL